MRERKTCQDIRRERIPAMSYPNLRATTTKVEKLHRQDPRRLEEHRGELGRGIRFDHGFKYEMEDRKSQKIVVHRPFNSSSPKGSA